MIDIFEVDKKNENTERQTERALSRRLQRPCKNHV